MARPRSLMSSPSPQPLAHPIRFVSSPVFHVDPRQIPSPAACRESALATRPPHLADVSRSVNGSATSTGRSVKPASASMRDSAIAEAEFDSISASIEAFRRGEILVVLDDPGRENEADLIVAAEQLSTEQMAWMIRYSSGYICAPVNAARADLLDLPLMVRSSQDPRGTAYTVSVDASHPSVTTGISAHDRALVCRTLADPAASSTSLRRPGHVLPLRAHPGGVRARAGHTEAAVEFCRLAGKLEPVAAICELVDDGDEVPGRALRPGAGMMRGEACIAFARKWGLKVCTIADLISYLDETEGKLSLNDRS